MWHKVSEMIGKPNKLSFPRAELDKVLNSSDYAPEALVALFKRDFSSTYSKDKGVREKYTLEKHALMVMRQYEKYFSQRELPAGITNSFFRVFLVLHDIGVPESIKKTGDKHYQHRYTVEIMSSVLNQLDFSEHEVKIAVALVSEDVIGSYIRGRYSGKKATEELGKMADEAGLPFYDFMKLLLVFYQVDAGSYTEDAGGFKSLDHLFVFDEAKGQMDFSVNVAAKVDQLKIYAEAFPNAIWLDDYDWHDTPYDNLKTWVKENKAKLDSGEIIKGNTFSYRYNLKDMKYQVRLSRSIKEALYTPHSILLLDHNWHDIAYDDLKKWVKSNREGLDSGVELKGRMFSYRRNSSTGKYQVRLRSHVKEALYSY